MRRLILAAAILLGLTVPAAAEERLAVELNKLEDFDGGCRSFFLFRNPAPRGFSAFEMALAILDSDGVIDRLLTIDAAPLPAQRTTLKIFEIPEIGCARIGEIILHDMPACTPDRGEIDECFAAIDLGSRAGVPLVK